MDNKDLDQLLKEHFENENIQVSIKLISNARHKVAESEKIRLERESRKSLFYVIILHILWTSTIVGIAFIFKGSILAIQLLMINVLLSSLLILIGCTGWPYFKRMNKEVGK